MAITGATGGLGLALVAEAVRRGHEVVAIGRSVERGRAAEALGATFVAHDLADDVPLPRPLLAGCRSVIHAAALSASWGRPDAFWRTNVDGTIRLLQAADDAGVSRFVFVSSPSIFACFGDREDLDGYAAPDLRPLNAYARTKLVAERLVLNRPAGTSARCAIRPRALVGHGDRVILPKLAELARRPRMPLPRGGRALVELTDLRDAAWAVMEADARLPAINGAAINISGGRPVSVRTLAQRLAAALDVQPRLIDLPIGPARLLAVVAEGAGRALKLQREPVLTRYTLATMAYSQTMDLEPARRLLGYVPQHDAMATLLDQAAMLRKGGVNP